MFFPNARLGTFAIVTLIALRVAIGWHFFMEGASKVRDGGFASTGFLSSATGPFADTFHSLIPDYDGSIRLDAEKMREHYQELLSRTVTAYHLTDEQSESAKKLVEAASADLKATYKESEGPIKEYKLGADRVRRMEKEAGLYKPESMRKQRLEIESKRRSQIKPVLASIDRVTSELEEELNDLGKRSLGIVGDAKNKAEEKATIPTVKLRFPNAPPIDVSVVDKCIPIFDMVIGILLVCGLLTPVAGIAAGLFLGSIVLTQFPGWPGAQPTYYQVIEMVACFVLAGTDAGRYAGLDFLPWSFWNRRKGKTSKGSKETSTKETAAKEPAPSKPATAKEQAPKETAATTTPTKPAATAS